MISTQLILIPIFIVLFIWGQTSDSAYNRFPVPFSKLATCKEFDIESKECRHFFPIESLKTYKTKEDKLVLKFYVMANKDANIVLTNDLKYGSVTYTAVIGGDLNKYSWLRNGTDVTIGLNSHVHGILSPFWAAPIVVRLKYNGQLEVSIPEVADPLLKADASDLDVKSVCIYAWDSDSRWFYDCTEEEDIFDSECQGSDRCKVDVHWDV